MYDIKHVIIDPDVARERNLIGKYMWFSVSPQIVIFHAKCGGQTPKKLLGIEDTGFRLEGMSSLYECILPFEEGTPCWMDGIKEEPIEAEA